MTEIILALSKFTYLLSATLTIGQLLSLTFFIKNSNGLIKQEENLSLLKNGSNYIKSFRNKHANTDEEKSIINLQQMYAKIFSSTEVISELAKNLNNKLNKNVSE